MKHKKLAAVVQSMCERGLCGSGNEWCAFQVLGRDIVKLKSSDKYGGIHYLGPKKSLCLFLVSDLGRWHY